MTKRDWLKAAAVSLGCLGMLTQSQPVLAAGPNVPAKSARITASDVALNTEGVLKGFVVDAQGKPQIAAKVTLKKGRFAVANTVTAKDGSFDVAGLKNGTYILETAQGQAVIRVWAERVAPPAAKPTLVVVSDSAVIRGQGEAGAAAGAFAGATAVTTAVVVGTVVTAAVITGAAVSGEDDAEEEADRANNRANGLQQTVAEQNEIIRQQQERITTLESSN